MNIPGKPADFEARWRSFVTFMNAVRDEWPVSKDPYGAAIQEHFFEILNQPNITEFGGKLTLWHAVDVLRRNTVPPKDAGFIMFVFVVFGAVWGNGGVIPHFIKEDEAKKELN